MEIKVDVVWRRKSLAGGFSYQFSAGGEFLLLTSNAL